MSTKTVTKPLERLYLYATRRDPTRPPYTLIGGIPIRSDSIIYGLLGGLLFYLFKGVAIFEWFWSEEYGMIGLLLRAADIHVAISSKVFTATLRPLDDITTPPILLPAIICCDVLRVGACLIHNFRQRRRIRQYNYKVEEGEAPDPSLIPYQYNTFKKLLEILLGYLAAYATLYLYISYRHKRERERHFLMMEEASGGTGGGPYPQPYYEGELPKGYLFIIQSSTIAVTSVIVMEEICRMILSHPFCDWMDFFVL